MSEGVSTASESAREELDRHLASSKAPGIQYVAVDSGRIVFEYVGGWADLGRGAPMGSTTTMMAYSMSKTLTAVAVLQLVAAERVRLDAPVVEYVASMPYGPAVTVRQLLAHTSGAPSPIPLRWVHLADRHAAFDESAALATVLRGHPRLAFPPGSRYAYSNIGYWLLGRVVEQASGEPFTTYVESHVLRPLGATPSELSYAIPDPALHAAGYLARYSFMNLAKGFLIDRDLVGEYDGRWLSIRSHYVNGPAFGGLVGSARGFGRFLQDQLASRSRLVGEGVRGLLYEPQRVARGTAVPMTLGWHVGDLGGIRFFYKEGGGGGFHSLMRLYPEPGLATVVMANATAFDVRKALDATDARFVR
ncbi:MAG TPA: serine hydrolase domain-containing protein [Vicinamibacteria bacterium]|nr:serine hydrolase domain-containing protein [Vicinamibacteria bacterium]